MINNARYDILETLYTTVDMIIYKAKERESGRLVAIKTVQNLHKTKKYRGSFKKEFDILSRFDSDMIEKPIEYFKDENFGLVSELAGGVRLRDLIEQKVLSHLEKVEIAIQLAKALKIVHHENVLHKDINPSNIMWDQETKKLILLDFNISEFTKSQLIELSQSKHLHGTVQYISPEQTGRINRLVDYRSDFYSLGITLYELFTGQLPFDSPDYLELIHSHIAVIPKAPSTYSELVVPNLSAIVMKLIEKNSEARYQTIDGLIYDLENYEAIDFDIAQRDIKSNFMLKEGLYGRAEKLQWLSDLLNSSTVGFKHVFISGYSGVGKTSLVNEAFKYFNTQKYYFLHGKYDQFASNVPYSAIKEIIKEYMDYLFVEGETHVETWKTLIQNRLSQLGAVLVEFMPVFEDLLGPQESVPVLTGTEAQKRFHHVVKQLLLTLVNDTHKIILFIDDLQWIDNASVFVLESLFEPNEFSNMVLIGAYRNNEVGPGHRLERFMHQLKESEIDLKSMELKGLNDAEILSWLEASSVQFKQLNFLTEVLLSKTNGNPFYLKQVMKHLNDMKCVDYESTAKKWCFKESCFAVLESSENVATFMSQRLNLLSKPYVQLLEIASCIGHKFRYDMLIMMQFEHTNLSLKDFQALVELGYLLYIDKNTYMFAHDQIQQAAYTHLDVNRRGQIHSEIANIYIDEYDLVDEYINDIARHVSLGIDYFCRLDLDSILSIFIRAGNLAIQNIAYNTAKTYYQAALEVLGDDLWEVSYHDALMLSNKLIEIFYMQVDFDRLDQAVALLEMHVIEQIHLATAREYQIQSLMGRQLYEEGITLTLKAFKDIGLDLSLDISEGEIGEAFVSLQSLIGDKKITSFKELPILTDQYQVDAMKMMTAVLPLLFNMAPQLLAPLTIEMVKRSIVNGNSQYSPFAYSFYGTLLCGVFRDYDNGYEYGKLAVELVDYLKVPSEIPKVYMLVSQHIFQYKEHLNKVLEMEDKAFNIGIDTGDLTYAGFAGHGYSYNYYLAGYHLKKSYDVFIRYTEALKKINQGTQKLFQDIYLQTIYNLKTDVEKPWLLIGEHFDETVMLQSMLAMNHRTGLFVYFFNKMEIAFIFKQFDEARVAAQLLKEHLDGGMALMQGMIYYQYDSLIQLATYHEQDHEIQLEILKNVEENQTILGQLRKTVNYEHRFLIVEAEKARVTNCYQEARDYYEAALMLVEKHRYQKEECIYRELISQFYQESNQHELEYYYASTAYNSYATWGAQSKTTKLPRRFKSTLSSKPRNSMYTLNSINTEFDAQYNIEIETILKFSHALAKEIKLEELLKTMLYILLENAGATKAVIINFKKDGNIIIAESDIENRFLLTECVDISECKYIPESIFNYSTSGNKVVRLDDVTLSRLFKNDPYFTSHKVQSLLSYPILNQGQCIGIIYLENAVATGVFSTERTKILRLLSSQIATSLENALVYEQLEMMVVNRTKDLALKNQELVSLNKKLRSISITDNLTGLNNRRRLDEVLESETNKVMRYQNSLSVILMDIDQFKRVNDTYGHHIGDMVLIEMGKVLINNVRNVDIVGRWGGEEFLIICPETTLNQAYQLAEKLRSIIEKTDFTAIKQLTCSFGVQVYNPEEPINRLLTQVDEMLYEAKNRGRNKVMKNPD